jgi:hypothetical protein
VLHAIAAIAFACATHSERKLVWYTLTLTATLPVCVP